MDSQKIQELRALLDAVPALPWRFEQMHISKFGIRDDHGYIAFLETRHPARYGSDPDREARARFLGAMTPDTVRALLDECETLRKDAERYRWLRDKSESLHSFYLIIPLWMTGVRFRQEDVDRSIDDAIAIGEKADA